MRKIYLFGKFRIIDPDGEPVKLATRKIENLFAYLWLKRERPQSRERLAGLFWPESSSTKSRSSLRSALYNITKTLVENDASCLLLSRDTAQFNSETLVWVDIDEFESKIEIDELPAASDSIQSLTEAVSLYAGDLLEGCYDDWCLEERDYLRERYLSALHQLVAFYTEQRDYDEAINHAREILAISPLHEEIHRQLMILYYANGDRNSAVQQYNECAELLAAELDVEPLAETQALYQEIEARSSSATLEEIADQARKFPKRYPELGSPFAGRVRECGLLTNAWDSAVAGDGQTILAKGVAGIGKTRLGQVFAEYVQSQGGLALVGRCHVAEGPLPYQPWLEVLRQAFEGSSAATLGRISTTWLRELLKIVPELSERFADLEPTSPLQSPDQERNRLFEGISRVLLTISQENPLLIILDDLHWADESTLQFAHYLARRLSKERIFLLGFHRVEEVGKDHPLNIFTQEAIREGLISDVELTPLSENDIKEMICGMLSICEEAPAELIEQITTSTKGNPFFIVELARSYIESGAVFYDENREWKVNTTKLANTSPPITVSALVESRLRQIGRWRQEILNCASMRSRPFDLPFLRLALRRSEDELINDIEALMQWNFLTTEDGGYAIQHDLIREVIYFAMLPERRRRLHLKTGLTLEALHQNDERGYGEQLAGELAHQFFEANEEPKALEYSLLAGDLAWSKSYAKEESLFHYQRAEDLAHLLHDQQARMRACKGIGEVCCWTDEQDKGLKYCEKAAELCNDQESLAEIYLSIAHGYHVKRDLEQGLSYCKAALESLSAERNPLLKVLAYADAASFLNWLRRYDDAISFCERALQILDREMDVILHSRILSQLGHAHTSIGEFEAAIDFLSAAANLAENAGDLRSAGLAHFNLAIACDRAGHLDKTIEALNLSLQAIKQLGSRFDELGAIYNRLTYAHMRNGDLEKGISDAQKQLENYQNAGEKGNIAMSYGMLAALHEAKGLQSEADMLFTLALETSPTWSAMYFSIIVSFLYLKDVDRASHWLDRGRRYLLPQHRNALKYGPPDLAETPEFASLRNLKRFKELFK